jgi:hypothetical protein
MQPHIRERRVRPRGDCGGDLGRQGCAGAKRLGERAWARGRARPGQHLGRIGGGVPRGALLDIARVADVQRGQRSGLRANRRLQAAQPRLVAVETHRWLRAGQGCVSRHGPM